MNMKKERLKYLDIMRVIAMITVVVCHYTRSLEYAGISYNVKILPDKFFGVYLGSFGVALFFIVSGVSLMYTYDGKLDIKKYIRKRILGIYPMFWIAYSCAFLYMFYKNKSIQPDIPMKKMFLTVIGMDGYTSWYGSNFYLLGEWFLGCLILLYILFPILKWGIDKHPVITGIVIMAVYIAGSLFYEGKMLKSVVFLFRIPEFAFGMYFVRYKFRIKWPIGLLSIAGLVYMWFGDFTDIEPLYTNSVVGILAFVAIYYICTLIKWDVIFKFCQMIGKYAYAVFLCHHVIIQEMSYHFSGGVFYMAEVVLLFVFDIILVAIASLLLYKVNSYVVGKINGLGKKQQIEDKA